MGESSSTQALATSPEVSPPPSAKRNRLGQALASPEAPPPPAKRNRLRKDEIVAHATRLFAERGYEAASMGELAGRVGLRKASLFHHFESKDVLYAAVVARLVTGARAAIARAVTSQGSYPERLDALTDAMSSLLVDEPFAARLLLREIMDEGPVVRGRLGSTIDEALVAFVEFLKAGQREGAFRRDLEPAHLAVGLLGILWFPFVVESSVERLTGTEIDASFVDARRAAVRAQIRRLALVVPTAG